MFVCALESKTDGACVLVVLHACDTLCVLLQPNFPSLAMPSLRRNNDRDTHKIKLMADCMCVVCLQLRARKRHICVCSSFPRLHFLHCHASPEKQNYCEPVLLFLPSYQLLKQSSLLLST